MEDSELKYKLCRARAGDEPALAALITWQMPAIRALASRAVCPGLAFDDAVQEGLIGLFHAIENFDADGCASFSTYANVCVQNAITDAQRAATRRKHAPLNESVPLDAEGQTPGPEEQTEAQEAYSSMLHSIATRLSAREKQVLALFLDGCSYGEIAARLNLSQKAVDNALQRVRAKLK
ncbi:sigma-70 family RNA polymerase sigma factor [uncultured Ruthenibacterium sp.]|uniref:sigma-70 family RNA polymerase sigma factor n=1 Tax=uncultured Ruthenibacterium sp. TaxID=1905347 RepID=UPI00349E5148